MTNLFKTLSVSAFAILFASACASTDDKYTVGVDDNDKYTSSEDGTDVDLAENQKFNMHPDGDGDHMKMDHDKMDHDKMDHKKMMSKKDYPMVGGAAMYPTKTIVENASQASNLTTLVAAVKQAELVETLSGPGPFTVFAPTNAAFSLVPETTVNSLMMDENRADLQKVLTAHVIPAKVTAKDLMMWIKPTGSYTAETVSGDSLTFYQMGDVIKVADENGTLATVTTADVYQSNGIVHVVNSVLVPK